MINSNMTDAQLAEYLSTAEAETAKLRAAYIKEEFMKLAPGDREKLVAELQAVV